MSSRSERSIKPDEVCLHDLVAAQAARTPDAVALVAGDRRLTYRDLTHETGRLAQRLAALGVGPEVRVGVFLSRSPALVTTLLGILEAGGAYVPLDPGYPRERLRFMLEDAGIAVLVTETALADLLPASSARVLVLDGESEEEEREAEPILSLPGHLAYLIYTSGSTGRPKAVAIEHRSAVAFVRWAEEAFDPAELEGVLASTSVSFDLSVFELFVPLSRGGRVILAADALELPRLPAAGEVTLVNTVPSAMAELVRAGKLPAGVRTVNLAGEPLKGSLARAVYAAGVERVLNLYGPSEATTYSTFEVVDRESEREPTIGKPIRGTRVRLLGPDFDPVPAGESGEICLGGAGLARGFLGRPELTAERFVPDDDLNGARLYRTGDLGRVLPDGRIEYLGRLDQQVKVRGFRIELGEIEVALGAHPGIRETVVVAQDGPRGKRLVAWFVAAEGDRKPSEAALREFLGTHLPAHMMPASFQELSALPLTPNRKVDHQALALQLPPEATGETRAPRNPTEELLVGIWEEVLGHVRIGIDERFLDLGGDSLLAARIQARVQETLALDLPPSTVLTAATIAALAERIERDLFERRSRPAPILPRPRDPRGEPLSTAQRRLWFLEQLVPGVPVNNIPVVMRLEGPLEPAVLEHCLTEIAARHQALRTSIRLGLDGEPLQVVASPAPLRLALADLSALPLDRQFVERRRLACEEARRPFEFSRDALWRLLLVRVGEEEHDLLVNFHHVIADGASIEVLTRELAALYPAFLQGRPSPLPPLPVQPADVTAWEREGLSAETPAPSVAWFLEQLEGAPSGVDLPADLTPPVRSWRGVSQSLELPPSLSREVRDFARRRGATRYMVLLAAWVALLRRITGQDDHVVGTVFAHRGRTELEGLIGYFADTLPLRIEHPGDPAFGDLLATVRDGALGVFAHQELPLEALADSLRPKRASSADPLFQVFFAYRGNAGPRELAPGLTLTWREEDHGAAQFDLLLDLEEKEDGIAGRLVASADLFTVATAERLALGWLALLADGLAQPEVPLSTLTLLGRGESHAVRVEWSRAPVSPIWDRSVPARIAAWADATPEAIAVEPAGEGQPGLTYRELMDRARRLASHLRSRGVGLDVLVGVYADRTPETLAGMLAVLLAGAAFLPLDPSHPPERLAMTLEDSGVRVLLARSALAATLPTGGAEVVPLETAAFVATESLAEVAPEDLAYVIYTSGSTGRPKGVLIQHRGFLWAVEALAERSGVEPGSRVLQFASASFDASVWEIWSTLIRGATLVFAGAEDLLPGQALLSTLLRRGITNVFLTPSALAAMPESAAHELSGLGGLVVGGEAFPSDLVTRWAAGRRLWNAYGPTEGSICVSMARLGEDGQTPIGRPVADSRLLVLGPHGEVLPQGVPGELYLGGRGLARGYLGRPDLTARAFVPDPAGEEAGGRLYRTGDLARFRTDGQLEFLGRADRQVKVRGFRIEPGEIEAQIVEHPGVREAAVVPYEAAPRDLRLAAYVAGAGSAALSVQDLRAFLRTRLPEHMVPSSFTLLDALPLTPGGKVDRRALLPPNTEEPSAVGTVASAIPRTPAEDLLAGIWEEVLGKTEIGPGDDFFDLGGHSLLVGQVLARVRTAFNVDLPVRAAFEARTLATLARRIEEARLAEAGGSAPTPLVPVSRDRPLPLSFGQERLWFLYRLDPVSPVYNLPLAFSLSGPLDPELLERSLDEIFRRHEVLRTMFAAGPDGEPHQIVAPFQPPGLLRIDLSGLPPSVAAVEAEWQMAQEARRPFDLVRGPVARAFLLQLGAREHLLVFSCHHAAFDGWSVGVLRRELGTLYDALRTGQPSPLPESMVQYADHAVWQRRRLSGEALAAQLAYWRQRLAGAPTALELPADRLRPPAQSFRGATLPIAVPSGLAAGLRSLARGEASTLFMTALAAFFALLGRLSGQKDLVVGSPVANRREAGSEDLLGFFVNTLALRADLAGDPPFQALAAQVRETALAAYEHQELPFERLVEELQPSRDPSRSPLFQVMFSLDPLQDGELAPGLGCELLRIDTGTSKFDLSLFLNDQGESLTALLEYSTDLFDAPTVARFGSSFLALMSGLVREGAGLPVSRLPLLGEAESWQIRAEWHDPGPPAPAGECLHGLVAAQVARTPEATALVSGRERITYRDLDLRASDLARTLAGLGVGPEVRVGVCLSRSSSLVISLLGILQAGGVYVPLDPNYPRERLGFMLEDADAAVLITETALVDRLPASQAQVLLIDSGPWLAPLESREPARVVSGNLAYLIYTSGSTGRPKAVAIEHRSVVAFIHWALSVFTPEELASVLASTSISFDLSVFELFVPLASGGQVVLAGSVLELPELPAAGEITLINSVPSAVSALLELVPVLPAGVQTVNLAGEPLKGSLAQALYASGVERVRNLYGPSEDTTYSTFETVERGSRREPTIGRPIAGTWARLLDPHLETVPVGVPGEIYLGGAGLARGYLGRPELTAERFVPEPDPLAPGARLYRTGDLGRFLSDGRIEYMGRLDNQVKVRGFRIELGEIETALEAHPNVREAVVVARGEPGGDRFLAAYVVAAGPPAPTVAELADHLRVRLAEFMVPTTFTLLDAMPLTPNGKVDRKALPPPGGTEPTGSPGSTFRPAAPLEELLAGIWAEVLGRAEVPGPQENFFALGGHSLLATRMVSRVQTALGIEVPLRAFFAAPTISALAAALSTAGNQAAAPPIEPHTDREDLPLSFAQQRLWLLDRLEPGSPVYNLPFPRLLQGPLDPAALEHALSEVIRRHEVLRTTFAVNAESGEPRLNVASPGGFSLPRVDLAALPVPVRAAEGRRLADEDAESPFDLAAGPIFRACLLITGAEEHHLLMTVHHIAGDGWSINLLLGELSTLYPAVVTGNPSPLPELPIQYADFAAWQRSWLDGPVLGEQLAYWRQQLAGAPAVLDLPTDRPRPDFETSRGAHFLTPLSADLTAAVRAFSRRNGTTLFMVLLAGFAALLELITGEPDLLLGSPVAGRSRNETEGLIGFFVNTLVLRVDLDRSSTFGTLVGRVREMALAAYAHQDVPFERLVEELQPERSLARSPLFQVSFVLGVEEAGRELAPGLPHTPLPVENHTSKFDLTLGLDLRGDTLVADLEYRTSLFDRTTVERWAGQFVRLLGEAVDHQDFTLTEIGRLAGIDPMERAEVQSGRPRLLVPAEEAVLDSSRPSAESPRTPLEELVAGLWAEVLGCGTIGLHDHFFALGGYSLLAVRVLARLRAATGVDLPLRAIFANPTVAMLAAEIERSLRDLQGPDTPALPPIAPTKVGPEAPLSPAQERLWYFHQLDRSGSVLNVPHPLRLHGPLRPAALAGAFAEIARRHDPLRTTFVNSPEGLRQRIVPTAVAFALPLVDLNALPPARRAEEARRAMEAEAREPFDLATGPLWRSRLLRLEAEEHQLLLSFHHIIIDGWSLDLLERELGVLYPAATQDLPSPLSEPVLQYSDFAVWQRRELTGERLAPQMEYWRRQLAGVTPVLDLPADRPRPQRPSFRGGARYLPLPPELAAQVKELGRREGTTLFMTALAAFAALLGASTGRTDLVLGSPAANRHTPGTEDLFGFFVGVLPFRLDLSGDPSFRELLRRARETALGAYAHPDVSFERLVEELGLAGDKSRAPLVQVMLSVRTGSGTPLRIGDLTAEPVEVHSATSQFDFTLGVIDIPQGLNLEAEYSTDLFTGATVERMLGSLMRLLGAVVADPETRISALPSGFEASQPVETAAPRPEETMPKPPAPTDRGARLAARRAGLSAEERALLEQRLRKGPRTEAPAPEAASLVALQPAGSRPPFFCVHPAGGDVLCFQALSRHLGPDQPFYGLQSRGIGPGETPFQSIEEMAARYRAEVTAISAGPYRLGGWSLGGAVAFEVARQLAAEGREVALLAVIDSTPGPWPPLPAGAEVEVEDDGDDTPWLLEIANYLERLWDLDLGLTPETLRGLSPEDQALRLLAGLKDTPFGAKAGPDSLRRLLAVFKTNVRALRRYRPAPYPGKITFFLPAEAVSDSEEDAGLLRAWGDLTPSPVDVQTVPGDHISALAEPHVRALAERLRLCIDAGASPGR